MKVQSEHLLVPPDDKRFCLPFSGVGVSEDNIFNLQRVVSWETGGS
jgi:hypothetical protein